MLGTGTQMLGTGTQMLGTGTQMLDWQTNMAKKMVEFSHTVTNASKIPLK